MGKSYEQVLSQKRIPNGQSPHEEVLSTCINREMQIKASAGSHKWLKGKSKAGPSADKEGNDRTSTLPWERAGDNDLGKVIPEKPRRAHRSPKPFTGWHSSIARSRRKLETCHTSISSRINKLWIVAQSYQRTRSSNKNKQSTPKSRNTDERWCWVGQSRQTLRSIVYWATPRCEIWNQVKLTCAVRSWDRLPLGVEGGTRGRKVMFCFLIQVKNQWKGGNSPTWMLLAGRQNQPLKDHLASKKDSK